MSFIFFIDEKKKNKKIQDFLKKFWDTRVWGGGYVWLYTVYMN